MKSILLFLTLIGPSSLVLGKGSYFMHVWFQFTNHTSLEITKSIGEGKPVVKIAKIKDKKYINHLVSKISALPLHEPEKMKSFSEDAQIWVLKFCDNEKHCDMVEFYNGKIQTPNTGFYNGDIDKAISAEIRKLIATKAKKSN